MFRSILITGYGAMASALLEGWLAAGIEKSRFTVHNPRPKPVPEGVRFTADVPRTPFDAVVLGFKPQVLNEAAGPLAGGAVRHESCVLSLLAGVPCSTLDQAFPGTAVRFMPNLAAKIGKSPVILYGPDLAGKQRTAVTLLAEATGGAFWLAIEGQFDAATALAGCGPAFVYRFIDAVMEGGVSLGLDAGEAGRLALRMVEGAAILAGQSERSPGQLADLVASPGGMTRKGLDVLDNDDALAKLVGEALRSAAHHGATLAGKPPSKGA